MMQGQAVKMQYSKPLPVFIALSLLIHAAWFISNQRSWFVETPSQDSTQMAVRIQDNKSHETKKNSPSLKQDDRKKFSDSAQTNHNKFSSNNRQHVQPQNDINQQARAKIIGHIKNRLVKHFTYPRLAQSRGWQGQVLLVFNLSSDGGIQHIQIKQGSGYDILDNSAITALRKIGRINQSELSLPDHKLELEIPIIYRLEG